MKKARLAIFVSGSGSNAEAIMRYFNAHPSIEVALLLSNNPQARALRRAEVFHVPTIVFNREELHQGKVLDYLIQAEITHVVLAGFLWLMPTSILNHYSHRVINIHPSLLPKFGGKGMYGLRVHEAVLAAGETESGLTIHEVTAHYDEGKIFKQVKCAVLPGDDASSLASRVLKLEHENYPRVIEAWITSSADQPN